MAYLPAVPNEGRIVRRYPLASGQTPVEGAAVYLVSGEITVCGADPSSVAGFAAHNDPTALALDPYGGDMLIYVAGPDSTFWLSGSTTPTAAHVGNAYGVAHDGTTEVTYVDITETTNTVVTVEDVDLTRNLFLVSILASVRQLLA